MKKIYTKKLFAFIIVTMMFSCFTEFALAQKTKTIFFCKCGYRNYGCKPGQRGCTAYCATQCWVSLVRTNTTSLNKPSANPNFQLSFLLFTVPQSEANSSKLFESKRIFIRSPINLKSQLIHEMEWSDVNALSISN